MITTKKCTTCGAEKPDTIEYFPVSNRFPDGTVKTLRGKCKDCQNEADRIRRQGKQQQPGQVKPVKEKTTEQPIQQQNDIDYPLTGEEVTLLREILKNYKQQDIEFTPEPKSRRLKKTYNLDMDIVNWINTTARDKGISASDVMNSLLRSLIK